MGKLLWKLSKAVYLVDITIVIIYIWKTKI